METLEELKAIVDNAPVDERATHIDEDGDYIESGDMVDRYFDGFLWVPMDGSICMRSLFDIKRIIELMEWQLGVEKKYKYLLETNLND